MVCNLMEAIPDSKGGLLRKKFGKGFLVPAKKTGPGHGFNPCMRAGVLLYTHIGFWSRKLSYVEGEFKLEGLCIGMPQIRQGKERRNELKQNEAGEKWGWESKTLC